MRPCSYQYFGNSVQARTSQLLSGYSVQLVPGIIECERNSAKRTKSNGNFRTNSLADESVYRRPTTSAVKRQHAHFDKLIGYLQIYTRAFRRRSRLNKRELCPISSIPQTIKFSYQNGRNTPTATIINRLRIHSVSLARSIHGKSVATVKQTFQESDVVHWCGIYPSLSVRQCTPT